MCAPAGFSSSSMKSRPKVGVMPSVAKKFGVTLAPTMRSGRSPASAMLRVAG